jgi:hypothetical protein
LGLINHDEFERATCSLRTLGDSARLFALGNLAGADAGIRSWNSKKHYNFWRPITAIQQILPEDDDGNPRTEADAAWTSLIATPPYPDYTSGANNLSGSFTTIARRFFNIDKVTFKVTTTATQADPKERSTIASQIWPTTWSTLASIWGFISASRTRRRGGRRLASRGTPSITSCGRFTIAVTIMTRSAVTTMMMTTGVMTMVVAATGTSKSEAHLCWAFVEAGLRPFVGRPEGRPLHHHT